MVASFNLKAIVTPIKAMAQFDRKTEAGMKRIGAIIRADARNKIKRRIVTDAMRGRLAAARQRGDKRAEGRILATIYLRQTTTSKPGEPPVAHVPDTPFRSIRDIRFHATRKSVIVGPAGGNQRVLVGSNRVTVPELMEKGGRAAIAEVSSDRGKTWIRKHGRRGVRSWQRQRTRTVSYASRPFMKPTLIQSIPKQRRVLQQVYNRM